MQFKQFIFIFSLIVWTLAAPPESLLEELSQSSEVVSRNKKIEAMIHKLQENNKAYSNLIESTGEFKEKSDESCSAELHKLNCSEIAVWEEVRSKDSKNITNMQEKIKSHNKTIQAILAMNKQQVKKKNETLVQLLPEIKKLKSDQELIEIMLMIIDDTYIKVEDMEDLEQVQTAMLQKLSMLQLSQVKSIIERSFVQLKQDEVPLIDENIWKNSTMEQQQDPEKLNFDNPMPDSPEQPQLKADNIPDGVSVKEHDENYFDRDYQQDYQQQNKNEQPKVEFLDIDILKEALKDRVKKQGKEMYLTLVKLLNSIKKEMEMKKAQVAAMERTIFMIHSKHMHQIVEIYQEIKNLEKLVFEKDDAVIKMDTMIHECKNLKEKESSCARDQDAHTQFEEDLKIQINFNNAAIKELEKLLEYDDKNVNDPNPNFPAMEIATKEQAVQTLPTVQPGPAPIETSQVEDVNEHGKLVSRTVDCNVTECRQKKVSSEETYPEEPAEPAEPVEPVESVEPVEPTVTEDQGTLVSKKQDCTVTECRQKKVSTEETYPAEEAQVLPQEQPQEEVEPPNLEEIEKQIEENNEEMQVQQQVPETPAPQEQVPVDVHEQNMFTPEEQPVETQPEENDQGKLVKKSADCKVTECRQKTYVSTEEYPVEEEEPAQEQPESQPEPEQSEPQPEPEQVEAEPQVQEPQQPEVQPEETEEGKLVHRESDCNVTECRKKKVHNSEDFTFLLQQNKYAAMTEDELLSAADAQDQNELAVLNSLNGKLPAASASSQTPYIPPIKSSIVLSPADEATLSYEASKVKEQQRLQEEIERQKAEAEKELMLIKSAEEAIEEEQKDSQVIEETISAERGKDDKEMYEQVDKLATEDKKIKDDKRELYTETEEYDEQVAEIKKLQEELEKQKQEVQQQQETQAKKQQAIEKKEAALEKKQDAIDDLETSIDMKSEAITKKHEAVKKINEAVDMKENAVDESVQADAEQQKQESKQEIEEIDSSIESIEQDQEEKEKSVETAVPVEESEPETQEPKPEEQQEQEVSHKEEAQEVPQEELQDELQQEIEQEIEQEEESEAQQQQKEQQAIKEEVELKPEEEEKQEEVKEEQKEKVAPEQQAEEVKVEPVESEQVSEEQPKQEALSPEEETKAADEEYDKINEIKKEEEVATEEPTEQVEQQTEQTEVPVEEQGQVEGQAEVPATEAPVEQEPTEVPAEQEQTESEQEQAPVEETPVEEQAPVEQGQTEEQEQTEEQAPVEQEQTEVSVEQEQTEEQASVEQEQTEAPVEQEQTEEQAPVEQEQAEEQVPVEQETTESPAKDQAPAEEQQSEVPAEEQQVVDQAQSLIKMKKKAHHHKLAENKPEKQPENIFQQAVHMIFGENDEDDDSLKFLAQYN